MITTSQVMRKVASTKQVFAACCLFAFAGCDLFSNDRPSCADAIVQGDMGRFDDLGNGRIFDPYSEVEWYRCAVGLRFTERGCSGSPLMLAWAEVEPYLQEVTEKAGETWRLPSTSELKGLMESSCINPTLNTNVFPNVAISNHWAVGEGVHAGSACVVYTYNSAMSCRIFPGKMHAFFMVKDRS